MTSKIGLHGLSGRLAQDDFFFAFLRTFGLSSFLPKRSLTKFLTLLGEDLELVLDLVGQALLLGDGLAMELGWYVAGAALAGGGRPRLGGACSAGRTRCPGGLWLAQGGPDGGRGGDRARAVGPQDAERHRGRLGEVVRPERLVERVIGVDEDRDPAEPTLSRRDAAGELVREVEGLGDVLSIACREAGERRLAEEDGVVERAVGAGQEESTLTGRSRPGPRFWMVVVTWKS